EDFARFSPSGDKFVVVAGDFATPAKNVIAIFSTRRDPPTLEWNYPDQEGAEVYEFAGWDGDERIRLRVTKVGLGAYQDLDAEVVHVNGKWILNKPKPLQ